MNKVVAVGFWNGVTAGRPRCVIILKLHELKISKIRRLSPDSAVKAIGGARVPPGTGPAVNRRSSVYSHQLHIALRQ